MDQMILCLAKDIVGSGFSPTMVAAIPRGGWVVAALLAQHLNVKKVIAVCQEKDGDNRKTYLAYPSHLEGAKVLVIEDSIETGRSLQDAALAISNAGAVVKTASLLISPSSSSFIPNYFLKRMIIPDFPWDRNPTLQEVLG